MKKVSSFSSVVLILAYSSLSYYSILLSC